MTEKESVKVSLHEFELAYLRGEFKLFNMTNKQFCLLVSEYDELKDSGLLDRISDAQRKYKVKCDEFDKMVKEFQELKESLEDFDPTMARKMLEKRNITIEKLKAKIDSVEGGY